ncbi:MAG: sensor domain-containing diguanylate cyclase [Planctomycetota bacterium]|jgi:diguanylate cyclase (GGDEF)-like protein
MFDDVEKEFAEGDFEKAFGTAKRHSIDLLRDNNRAKAAVALAQAGRILCAMNNPSKGMSFAQEAFELARRSGEAEITGFAETVRALAYLRAGHFEQADAALDRASDFLRGSEGVYTAVARITAAEISLAQDDLAETRAFAEDAYAIGASINNPHIRAHARLIKAVCDDRTDDEEAAIELLDSAENEMRDHPHAHLAWQIKAAMATVCTKSGRDEAASDYRDAAEIIIEKITGRLSKPARQRFLQSPAVLSALGKQSSESGIFRVPLQVQPAPAEKMIEERSVAKFRPMFEIIKKINSELNLRKLITLILDTMIEYCNAERGTLVIFEGSRFKIELSRNTEKTPPRKEDLGLSRTVLKRVRETGKKIVTDDARSDQGFKLIDSVHDMQLLSILCVPLRVKTRLVGAVYLDNRTVARAFGEQAQEFAELLTDHAAIAIDNALLRIRSIHDALTSLYNHPHFEKRLEAEVNRARRHNRPCGLLMLDLDDFKQINDSIGHEAGNVVLRAAARTIAGVTRNVDLVARVQQKDHTPVVARYGGDEFEVILPEADRAGIRLVAQRLLEQAAETRIRSGKKQIPLRFSIGGASYPEDASDFRTLILRADEALYAAKRAGKNRFVLYGDSGKVPLKVQKRKSPSKKK